MAYFAPYIDSTGMHIPLYSDIDDYLLQQYASIMGQSVTSNMSTTDVQSVSIFSLIVNDCFQFGLAVYNGMAPSKAIGAQQDSLYKLNGIARLPATFSVATVTVTGVANTQLTNAVAQDQNGNLWNLPTSFIIPSSGSVDVAARCQTVGAINAGIGTINIINTPTLGWYSVYNNNPASPGTSVEVDSAFRARQALSVALPSRTLVNGILAGIAAVPGVTRYGTIGVENPTGVTDSYGNPPHSISMVIEGGADTDIANAIYLNKTPGCYTNGTTTVQVADPITGQTMPISFFRPTYVAITVVLTVKAFTGYTTATTTAIQNAVANYLNSLQIGERVSVAAIIAVAMNVNSTLLAPTFAVQSYSVNGGNVDVMLNFNQVAQGNVSNVTVNVT